MINVDKEKGRDMRMNIREYEELKELTEDL